MTHAFLAEWENASIDRKTRTVELIVEHVHYSLMSDRAKRADRLAALAELKRTREGGARKWKVRHHCHLA
jgi:hypothetical protein